jgi:hypothetical protein
VAIKFTHRPSIVSNSVRVAMGYGGTRESVVRRLGKAGDEGIRREAPAQYQDAASRRCASWPGLSSRRAAGLSLAGGLKNTLKGTPRKFRKVIAGPPTRLAPSRASPGAQSRRSPSRDGDLPRADQEPEGAPFPAPPHPTGRPRRAHWLRSIRAFATALQLGDVGLNCRGPFRQNHASREMFCPSIQPYS